MIDRWEIQSNQGGDEMDSQVVLRVQFLLSCAVFALLFALAGCTAPAPWPDPQSNESPRAMAENPVSVNSRHLFEFSQPQPILQRPGRAGLQHADVLLLFPSCPGSSRCFQLSNSHRRLATRVPCPDRAACGRHHTDCCVRPFRSRATTDIGVEGAFQAQRRLHVRKPKYSPRTSSESRLYVVVRASYQYRVSKDRNRW